MSWWDIDGRAWQPYTIIRVHYTLYDLECYLNTSVTTNSGRSTTGPWYCFRPWMPYHINPRMTNPQNTAIDQFMVTAVTGIAGGKNEKKTEMTRKMALKVLAATPKTKFSLHGP